MGYEAFAGTALNKVAPLEGLVPKRQAPTVPAGIRAVGLHEAKDTGIRLNLEELLAKHPLPPTPDGKVFNLHPWQIEDIASLVQWDRVGEFLPVGAGKTVIATLVALAWNDEYRVVLVPPILTKQWVKWINSIPDSGGAVAYEGTVKKRNAIELHKHRWWIMSYGIFKNDFDKLQKLLRHRTFALIVDEAQNIKNTGSALWKHCNTFSLGQKLCLMTGTELNKPDDAYGYIKIKTPGIYRSFGHFKNVHVGSEDFFGTPTSWVNLEMLNKNLYMQSVQRTKEEVHAHLPKANYIPFYYDLDAKHQKLYNELAEQQVIKLAEGGKIDATTSQSLYNYCQQIIIDWARFADDESVRPAAFDLLDYLIDQTGFDQTGGPNKFIVWTWFKSSTKRVGDYLKSLYPGRVVLAYSDSDSRKAVDAFMEDPNTAWLVSQPLSAGAGLNPQYICYNAVFLEFPTRTILFRQSGGRIDREGQALNANIWIGIADNTIQAKMYKNLLSNDELVQKVQGGARDLRQIIHGV